MLQKLQNLAHETVLASLVEVFEAFCKTQTLIGLFGVNSLPSALLSENMWTSL